MSKSSSSSSRYRSSDSMAGGQVAYRTRKGAAEFDLSPVMLDLDRVLKDPALFEETQRAAIRHSLEMHLSRNEQYRDYFASFRPDAASPDECGVEDIPLLPSSLFKRKGLMLGSVPDEEIIKNCTSSGTRGSVSSVPRDEDTLTNFLGSISSALACLFGLDRSGNH